MGVWNSVKPCVDHAAAEGGDDIRAQHNVAVHLLAAQIEEAVLEADVLPTRPHRH
jgi:hypothetical protein